jgi:hypothetical protein
MNAFNQSGSTRLLTLATAVALLVLPAAASVTAGAEVAASGQQTTILGWD